MEAVLISRGEGGVKQVDIYHVTDIVFRLERLLAELLLTHEPRAFGPGLYHPLG